MQLFAYSLLGPKKELIVWVGVRGVFAPSPSEVAFSINGEKIYPKDPAPFESLPKGGLSFSRAVFVFDWPVDASTSIGIAVSYGDQSVSLTSKRLPDCLPEYGKGNFNLLLLSCYYQPNDKAGESALSRQIRQIKPSPDFIYFAGDQVYLDLPSFESLPDDETKLASIFEEKYSRNWFPAPNQSGLAEILNLAPVLCIPDDHEYWNNFPYRQAQLNNTWLPQDKENWKTIAQDLYRLYQTSPAQQQGCFRVDIEPLSMLFLDGRSERDNDGNHMFTQESLDALYRWKNDLLAKKDGIGLLSTGQVLLMKKQGRFDSIFVDAEMPNFQDHAILKQCLEELIGAGIPVIYLTGDVHWGRITEGKKNGDIMLYEIISSPSRLQDFVGKDQINDLKGRSKPFPRHDDPPEDPPEIKLANLVFCVKWRQTGDHVAMLKFSRIPGGVALAVDYICTDIDAKKRNAFHHSIEPVSIRNLKNVN